MVQLKQVVSSILTDISKAQIIADRYANRFYDYYQDNSGDPKLKGLTAPRMGIQSVTIDLKFAINQLEYQQELYTDYLQKGVTGQNVSQIEIGAEGKVIGTFRQILPKVWSVSWTGDANAVLSRWTIWHEQDVGGDDIYSIIFDNDESKTLFTPSRRITISINLAKKEFKARGHDLHHSTLPYRVLRATAVNSSEQNLNNVDVEVTSNHLSTIPESAISSISMNIDMTTL